MGDPRWSVTGAGQRIACHGTLNDFLVVPSRGVRNGWNGTRAGKPTARLLRLQRSKRVFHRSMTSKQGARLVRAFLRITDPTVRLAIVQMIENVGSAPADRIEDQPLLNQPQPHELGRQVGRPRLLKVRQVDSATTPADTKRAHHKGQDL